MKQSSSYEEQLEDDIKARSMCTRARASNCRTLRNWSKETISRFENNLFPVRDWSGEACPAWHGGSESAAMSRIKAPATPGIFPLLACYNTPQPPVHQQVPKWCASAYPRLEFLQQDYLPGNLPVSQTSLSESSFLGSGSGESSVGFMESRILIAHSR